MNDTHTTTGQPSHELQKRYDRLIALAAGEGLDDTERESLRTFATWLNKSPLEVGADVRAAMRNKAQEPKE